jgi:ATP-binding cassette subfamily B multidrug efflux pump
MQRNLKPLRELYKYFNKYKWRLILGLLFVTASNLFAILSPSIVKDTLDRVYDTIQAYQLSSTDKADIYKPVMNMVMIAGCWLIGVALLRGIFMFFMRQTIIVMSRHIEYDQKDEIFVQYQKLSTSFYKTHATGDMMSRISEDVSRVRMYTGPAIMYVINLIVLIALCLWQMLTISVSLTIYTFAPLPLLAFIIFYVNKIVNRKSEKIQAELSDITAQAQESYSNIRVIKSFAQENKFYELFEKKSSAYRKSTINLNLTEAIYTPAMTLFIGLSMILTIMIGGSQAIAGTITLGNIAQFVMYINMLMFPISAIGWTANMIQRAAVSQRRINEFLLLPSEIKDENTAQSLTLTGDIAINNLTFTYPHTGITALNNFSLHISAGQKIAIIGKTGSGKSTLAHLLLRMYDAQVGTIQYNGVEIQNIKLQNLRSQISYVPQEVFLFSDTIAHNIDFAFNNSSEAAITHAATMAAVNTDIAQLPLGYETITGERGVMLSGGQKQRIAIARALLKKSPILILDDCLSAVDTRTEQLIQQNLTQVQESTMIIITHRIFKDWNFDSIIVLDEGAIIEQGNHEKLMELNGYYAQLYRHQSQTTRTT